MADLIKKSIFIALVVAGVLTGFAYGASSDELKMGGTGAATKLLEQLGALCVHDAETKTIVVPSLGSSGGIRALSEGALDLVVAGRPLKPEETAKGLTHIATVRTPYVLITSHTSPNGLKGADVADIYASLNPTWADGKPIRIILRPKTESDTAVLGQLFPGMAAALEQAGRRRDVPIAATDQDSATMAESVPGSLAGASYTQIKVENRGVRLVTLDGVEPTLENLERGAYRYDKTLYFIVPTPPSPAVERFITCVRSPLGVQTLRDAGSLPGAN